MVRPCFLVVDREFPGSISTRKLVIETAKFNVLTAYSADEGLELLRLFPAVSGVVIDDGIEGVTTASLVAKMKDLQARLPIIVVAAPDAGAVRGADVQLPSFEPAKLLEALRKLEPQASNEIERTNEALSRKPIP